MHTYSCTCITPHLETLLDILSSGLVVLTEKAYLCHNLVQFFHLSITHRHEIIQSQDLRYTEK